MPSRATWRFTGITPSSRVTRFEPKINRTIRSFRRLNPDQRMEIYGTNMHVVTAKTGEDINTLSARTQNTWSRPKTAIANGFKREVVFEGGELVKIVRSERYETKPAPAAD